MDHRGDGSRAPDVVREQAIAWLARLRSGPTDDERAEFLDWYSEEVAHTLCLGWVWHNRVVRTAGSH